MVRGLGLFEVLYFWVKHSGLAHVIASPTYDKFFIFWGHMMRFYFIFDNTWGFDLGCYFCILNNPPPLF